MPTTRERLRFSLRSLLLLVLLIALWLGWQVHRARRQREAVAIIKAFGGHVYYDWESRGPEWAPKGRRPPGPAWLRRAIGDEYFQEVEIITFTRAAPGAIRVVPTLRAFPSLKVLDLHESQATDASLAVVGDLASLETLDLYEANVTDAGIARLKGLKNLKRLGMSDANLGDESLTYLKNLP